MSTDKQVKELMALADIREALEPFARFACADPHTGEEDCHNCKARAAIANAKGEEVSP